MMMGTIIHDKYNVIAGSHQRVIVHKILSNIRITPLQAYEALSTQYSDIALFEAHPNEPNPPHYTCIGFNPRAQLVIQDKGDVQTQIRQFYQNNHALGSCDMPGFAGGVFGYFSYEFSALFEDKLVFNNKDIPAVVLTSYQDHLIFDHSEDKLIIATVVESSEPAEERLNHIEERLNHIEQAIYAPILNDEPRSMSVEASTYFDDAAYVAAGQHIQEHIEAGDAFQIVLARTFEQAFTGRPIDILKALKLHNPSQYMFLFSHGDHIFCGASPEKMVSVHNRILESCPLAGTRPRGDDYDDTVQESDLLADTKEVAEHMMLVDLARNDLGMIAKPGTVKVSALKKIKRCSRVMHISSTVNAILGDGKDAVDALTATLPAGTLSGAPKLRAMQIIDSLEPQSRGLYGGAIGYIDNKGDLDSCIAIRMAVLKDGMAYVTAGAGITADSNLQQEAHETRHKAKAILEAIAMAQRGGL